MYNKKSPALSDLQVARRKVLKGAASLGVVSLVSTVPVKGIASPLNVTHDNVFVTVSKILTGRSDLLPILHERFYEALSHQFPQFDSDLNALAKELAALPPKKIESSLTPHSLTTAKAILSAWYTGIVGQGVNAKVITYRHALEFEAVDDVLQIRSYCPNKPGYWAAKPVEKQA